MTDTAHRPTTETVTPTAPKPRSRDGLLLTAAILGLSMGALAIVAHLAPSTNALSTAGYGAATAATE